MRVVLMTSPSAPDKTSAQPPLLFQEGKQCFPSWNRRGGCADVLSGADGEVIPACPEGSGPLLSQAEHRPELRDRGAVVTRLGSAEMDARRIAHHRLAPSERSAARLREI